MYFSMHGLLKQVPSKCYILDQIELSRIRIFSWQCFVFSVDNVSSHDFHLTMIRNFSWTWFVFSADNDSYFRLIMFRIFSWQCFVFSVDHDSYFRLIMFRIFSWHWFVFSIDNDLYFQLTILNAARNKLSSNNLAGKVGFSYFTLETSYIP